MKKYFRFLSLLTIIAIVASMSLLAPLSVNAGSLTEIQVSLSSYDVSSLADPVDVNLTANVTLATQLSGTAGDKVVITFNEYEAAMENQFLIDEASLVAGDITLSCDTDDLAVDSIVADDGAGTASGIITITTAAGSTVDVCDPASVLTIAIANARIRTPYTADTTPPSGYRIKFETTDTTNALEDSGTAAVFINDVGANQVLITGTVDPVLTMSLNTNACDLGVLTKDQARTCSYTVTVGTNADLGYGAYIQSDGELDDNITLAKIQSEADGDDNDQIDNDALLSASEYGIGVETTDTIDFYPDFTTTGYGTCAAAADAGLTYDIPVGSLDSGTANRFAYSTDPVDATTSGITTLCHVARISGDQPSGNFTQTVTITVVGNF